MVCISLRPSTLNGKSDSDISSVSVGDTGAKSDRTACKRASSVQSAQSNPTPGRTVSTDGGTTAGMPVGPYCDHRWGFPCCVWSPMRTCHRHYPGRFDGACPLVYLPSTLRPSLCNSQVGCSCNCFFGACSAFTHVMVHARRVAKRPSTPKAPTASLPPLSLRLLPGGANQFPGGELHPLKTSAFHGALFHQLPR
jgi:hypothetical protein